MNILFGPIYSRRFGKSLGVDLSPSVKQCNFDCLYCELESANTRPTQSEVLPVDTILSAIKAGLRVHKDIDVLTITANGEPTLYPHLLTLIKEIDAIKGKIKTLILSNGSTIAQQSVQEALAQFDEVKLSLDCATQRCLKRLDRAHQGIDVEDIKAGMLAFKKRYQGALIIEILLVKNLNDSPEEIAHLNHFLLQLQPTRIDIGTIDRPPAFDVKPLSYEALLKVSHYFDASLPLYIASRHKATLTPTPYTHEAILDTLAKRPLTQEDIEALMDNASQARLMQLQEEGKITTVHSNGIIFYKKV